jgi:hypothetical protein
MGLVLTIRFLHVLSAALWMGAALWWPGVLRRALAGDPPDAAAALALARRGTRVDLAAGLATIVTGAVYLSPLTGIAPRVGLWLGLGLALARVGLLHAMALPALRRVAAALSAGEAAAAREASRRLPAYAGAAHLVWLLALAVMVYL